VRGAQARCLECPVSQAPPPSANAAARRSLVQLLAGPLLD